MAIPLCPYYGACGGCSLQHFDHAMQLDIKKKALFSLIKFDNIEIISGNPYHYRNRLDLVFHPSGLGFRKKGEWNKIIDIEKCAIGNERLNTLLAEVRKHFVNSDYYDLNRKTGTFRYAVIRTPKEESSISFVLDAKSTRISEAVEKIKTYSAVSTADNIIVTYVERDDSISEDFFVVKGKDMLVDTFLGKKLAYSVQGFFQNNPEIAEKMIQLVYSLLEKYPTKSASLLDLYGGVGTFGIVCSGLFSHTTIVESFAKSIDAANANILANNLKNISAYALEANKLRRLKLCDPLYLITDPPRSGMDQKSIDIIKELSPEVIIYVSCNPQQLAKDILKFKKYQLKSAYLLDMFPQTYHYEAVVELVKIA
ncbi:MAG: 23S rRNA (uracil(1939)-C(5))-methyltransferase RlmD [Nanoarchaeota archaeon]|nr:23S rRNA (uracil(1939)-C(5))-methyltransferase RlmD [Nanoarchaeota archaeon]